MRTQRPPYVPHRSRILLAAVSLAFALAASACGDDSADDTPQEVGIPRYDPSDLVSEATGSMVLTTSDSVEDVKDFYVDFAEEEGWTTVSETGSDESANINLEKSGDGANIAVSTSGDETVISISTYPSR
jgi:hypothetical protein